MSREPYTYRDIIGGLRRIGLRVDLFRDQRHKYWRCTIWKQNHKAYGYAAGTTRMSALWASVIELIKQL